MDGEDGVEMRILVASDIHLGYAERDNIRKMDSFDTFEEVLQLAIKNDVDMLLLGGDLFHENKPSRSAMFQCTELLRKYCMNDRPVKLDFISDASVNFDHSAFPHPNYMDPNFNIGLPVFSINGNHDDLSGNGLAALDQLHAAGLINYFGKYRTLDELNISPVLLRKRDRRGHETKLALYGFGSIRDQRLNRLFQTKKVKFLTFGDASEQRLWFNLLVIHQNRVPHTKTNYIPEELLPEFFDLVIWGHEHPCRIEPEESVSGFKVMQPGSTVATSLAEGEAGQKCVSLLKINGKTMTTETIALKTVRPFYFENIALSEEDIIPGRSDTMEKVEQYCKNRVKSLIRKAREEHPNNLRAQKPLIRLRVDYTGGFDIFNVNRFGNSFVDMVANSKDLVLFHKKRELKESANIDVAALRKVMKDDAQELRYRVEDLVKKYFATVDKSQKLLLLTDNALGNAVSDYVEKDETNAIQQMVKQQLEKTQKKLKDQMTDKCSDQNAIKKALEGIRDVRLHQQAGVSEDDGLDGTERNGDHENGREATEEEERVPAKKRRKVN